MYREEEIIPLRDEAERMGCKGLRTAYDVKQTIENLDGVALVLVNSVCGCAAKMARPGLKLSLQGDGKKPDHLFTVFAGQDPEATNQLRSYFPDFAPSSPSIGLIRDGKGVSMLARQDIEGKTAEEVAERLRADFEKLCE